MFKSLTRINIIFNATEPFSFLFSFNIYRQRLLNVRLCTESCLFFLFIKFMFLRFYLVNYCKSFEIFKRKIVEKFIYVNNFLLYLVLSTSIVL